MRRALALCVAAACGGSPAPEPASPEVEVGHSEVDAKELGPETKVAADAIVHAYELIASESVAPGDPSKMLAAAVEGLGWTAPMPWTTDHDKDRDLLRGVVRALAQRGKLPADAVLRAARAMTLTVGDVNTFALGPAALRALFALIDGGAVVQPGMLYARADDTHWLVSDVFANGPAQRAGVTRGDVLVSIDGTPIVHGYIDFAYLFGARPGTEARLVVRHGRNERSLVLKLAPVASPITESRVFADGVGYIRIWACTHSTDPAHDAAGRVAKVLADFDHRHVKKLVLDLRGNAGGFPFDVASLFVEADPLMYGISPGVEQPVARTKVAASKTKRSIAVLVDEATGSGAEMIALAVHEHANAIVVGRPTAGGLTFPTNEKLAGDVTLSYPVSRVGTAKTKEVLEGNRLAPQVLAPNPTSDDYAANRDPQLDAAIAALGAM